MDLKFAKENLILFKSALDKHKITFWLAYGTCLGAIREQNFIEDDYDIDVNVYRKDKQRFLLLLSDLQLQQFECIESTKDYMKLRRNQIDLDIYFCRQATMFNQKGWRSGFEFIGKNFFTKLDTITFNGQTYKVPHPVDGYLEYLYGKNWEQKINNFWEYDEPALQYVSSNLRKENLSLIKRVFDEFEIKFWLSGKICINAITLENQCNERIVLNAFYSDQGAIMEHVLPALAEFGFQFQSSYIYCWPIILKRQNEAIEIHYAFKPQGLDRLRGYKWIVKNKPFRENFFEPFEEVDFMGEKYYVPQKITRYLDYVYGTDIWRHSKFQQLFDENKIDLISQIIQHKSQVSLAVKEPWLIFKRLGDHLLIPYGESIRVSSIQSKLQTGNIILVKIKEQLAITLVIKSKSDERFCIVNNILSLDNIWINKNDVLGQVISIDTRFGFTISLKSFAIRFIFKLLSFSHIKLKSRMNCLGVVN